MSSKSKRLLAISLLSHLISGSHSFSPSVFHSTIRNHDSVSILPPMNTLKPGSLGGITTSSALHLSLSSSSPTDATPPAKRVIDISSLAQYPLAAITQLAALFSTSFLTLDSLLARFTTKSVLPSPLTFLLFYAMSLKSRVFNPLNNRRPNAVKAASGEGSPGFKDRIMPAFTPPGYVFPIVWLVVMPSLRAAASTIVVNSLGRYCDVTVMALVFHLTCGDIWNTINNAEKRYGTSVLANTFTYLSAVYASLSYGIVDPLAGKLLGLTCVWLTIASCLITQTWRLNLDDNGKKDSILPMKGKGEKSPTKFWFL